MSEIRAVDYLRAAKALIDTPHKWVRHAFAADKHKAESVHFTSEKAACFCSVGALNRAGYDTDVFEENIFRFQGNDEWISARSLLRDQMNDNIIAFNDSHSHEEVISAFNRAIRRAENDEY